MGEESVPVVRPPAVQERHRAIAEALEQAGDATHFVPGEEGYLELPVVTVASNWLVYRADNGRILSELADAAQAQGTTMAALKAERDSEAVQRLLHDLLADKARDPEGPIYQELARHGRQTEPLLIARDGLVVNGNRRLAAMRELAAEDPGRYEGFTTIRAAVLPENLDREQLEYIEAALQMAPELKLGYSWINRRLKLREHARDLGRERVVAAYGFADADQVDVELDELSLAEEYLEWFGESGHYRRDYRRVVDKELRFTALQHQLAEIGAEHVRELWKRVGFAMIRADDRLEANIAHYYPFTDPVPPAQRHWVIRRFAEDHGLVAAQPAGHNRPVDPPLAARLKPLLDDPARAESTARAVIALIDTLKGDPQRLLGTHRVLHHLRAAREALESQELGDVADADVRSVRAELAALDQHVRAFEQQDPGERPLSIRTRQRLAWPLRAARRALGRLLGS